MKPWVGFLVILMLCGCIYDVPLVENAEVAVDSALKGIWQKISKEGKLEDTDERLLIFPFSKTEYLTVVEPGGDSLYFRAYPVRLEGMLLIQLEWLNAGENDHPYTVCRVFILNGLLC